MPSSLSALHVWALLLQFLYLRSSGSNFGDVSGHLERHFTPPLLWLSFVVVVQLRFIAEYIARARALLTGEILQSELGRKRKAALHDDLRGCAGCTRTNYMTNRGSVEVEMLMVVGCVIDCAGLPRPLSERAGIIYKRRCTKHGSSISKSRE